MSSIEEPVSSTEPPMSSLEAYYGRVQAILWAAADYVSADGLREPRDLVEHGEPAEGMCSLAWAIVNEGRHVPRSLIQDIRRHAEELVDESFMPPNLDEYASDAMRA